MAYSQYREILDCLDQPAFLVKNGEIIFGNAQDSDAEEALRTILMDSIPQDVQTIADERWNFSLRPLQDAVLVLASPNELPRNMMRDTAKALRTSLAGLYSMVHALLPSLEEQDNPRTRQQTAALNHNLHQLFRLVGNMETASTETLIPHMERLNLVEFLEQLYSAAAPLCALTGKRLILQLPDSPIRTTADRQILERAILNLISNAIRASGDGDTVTLRLYTADRRAVFEVQNHTEADNIFSNLFQPTDETMPFAGLGLEIVRKTAKLHGGTLMFRPIENGIAAMLSISIRQVSTPLRSVQIAYDYTGGFDHLLLELSDILPPAVYQSLNID